MFQHILLHTGVYNAYWLYVLILLFTFKIYRKSFKIYNFAISWGAGLGL